ncbi:MAG: hypothetical protein QME71_06265 [Dehalococcoidia bacterium]|nr:hypothetical protein [Dehalococcoidia bacterium]
MKVELEVDEAWALMSHVLSRMLEETQISDEDRARIRLWRSQEMQPSREGMRLLAEKINQDLAKALASKERSQIRRPDWR